MVSGTKQYFSLGGQPIQLHIHHLLGTGSTGVVFSASLDVNGIELTGTKADFSHVIKVVSKGNSSESKGRVERLQNEFAKYKKIEKARLKGYYEGQSIPHCYGLFESELSLVMVLDYAGEPVENFDNITVEGRYVSRY